MSPLVKYGDVQNHVSQNVNKCEVYIIKLLIFIPIDFYSLRYK